ncbi:Hypothetical protein FKW44_004916 [Caligus rogercresseyi]|uniref:Uncharacterized protein n=1 Tax=Caligus rogercresseyi TaxID=217165 RepID=A0A7T8KAW7_CALRO|nr:Hypothetical protein FKW44_004916 [Caligus rogercresseyi]
MATWKAVNFQNFILSDALCTSNFRTRSETNVSGDLIIWSTRQEHGISLRS